MDVKYEDSESEPAGEVHPCAGKTRIRIHYFKDKLTGIESHAAETSQCSKCGLHVCAACTAVSDACTKVQKTEGAAKARAERQRQPCTKCGFNIHKEGGSRSKGGSATAAKSPPSKQTAKKARIGKDEGGMTDEVYMGDTKQEANDALETARGTRTRKAALNRLINNNMVFYRVDAEGQDVRIIPPLANAEPIDAAVVEECLNDMCTRAGEALDTLVADHAFQIVENEHEPTPASKFFKLARK